MHLKTVTNAKEVAMLGLSFVKTDKAITEVIIGSLHIRKGESYQPGLQVLMEAPFSEETKWRLTATIKGFDPKVSYHDSNYDAGVASNDLSSEAETEIVEVRVMVDDNGAIVSTLGNSTPINPSEVPF